MVTTQTQRKAGSRNIKKKHPIPIKALSAFIVYSTILFSYLKIFQLQDTLNNTLEAAADLPLHSQLLHVLLLQNH